MHRALLEILVDPVTQSALDLEVEAAGNSGEIVAGRLRSDAGNEYPIRNGIPRFVSSDGSEGEQTRESFGFKWSQRSAYEPAHINELTLRDELQRFGFETAQQFRSLFRRDGWVLDMGCGSGHYASLYLNDSFRAGNWVGTDFSTGIDMARERLGDLPGTHFVQGAIFRLPYREGTFDLILCRGVMHHTPSTEKAFQALVPLVKPGGEFIFLVYRKNGPIREFTDDHIRGVLSRMPPEQAWEELKPLTKLGKVLSNLKGQIEVPEDIPYLDIEAGKYDLHQFFYDHFLKAYWNANWNLEENNLISFDWFHPQYAFRHTEEEIRGWCERVGLLITHLDARWTSFTVRAVKPA